MNSTPLSFSKEPRPVYYRELDILGFDKHWNYEKQEDVPYMWAEANSYWYRGRKVAQTKGGSLYCAPELVLLEDPEPDHAPLRPVDIDEMVRRNHDFMQGFVQETIRKVYNTWKQFRDKVDVFYVAFSGGKDSIVTLDIVQNALPHDAFMVLFGDTQMEFPDTYEVVDKIKQQCEENGIQFLTARSEKTPKETWDLIGPPAQKLRWCCGIHKWLWQQDTIDAQIRSVTLDYRIIEQTNAVLRSKYTSFDESIEGWANACKYIHISYLNAKNYWQELKPLMEALYDIKRKGELPDAKRTDFLSLILAKGEAFWTFYTSGQVTMFKQVCSIELGDLNDEEVGEIYKRLGNTDCFAMEIQPYRDLVKNTVKAWMEGQKRVVLLTAWKNTTGTLSPKDWSDKYTMPILCMVSPEDEVTARSVFNTVNTAARTAISGDAVDRALRFIEEHPQLFDSLSDESARDEAFRRNMLGKNDIILSVEQVKSYLRQRMHCDPYDWYKLTEVEKEIEKLAQHEYEGKGYIRVSSIVDGMDAATAKRYLKALIEKNKTVGIEILREQHQ